MLHDSTQKIKPVRPEYVSKPKYWACDYIRLIFMSGAVSELGNHGAMLLCHLVTVEDQLRYTAPPKFWRSQIESAMGWTSPKQHAAAVDRCRSAGWLETYQSSKRSVTEYHLRIPSNLAPLLDKSKARNGSECGTFPSPISSENGTGLNGTGSGTGSELGTDSGTNPGTSRGTTPNPVPIPTPALVGAAADLASLGVHPPTAQSIAATHPPDEIADRLSEYSDALRRGIGIGPGAKVSRFRDGAWPAEGVRTADTIRAAAAAVARSAAAKSAETKARQTAAQREAAELAALEATHGGQLDALPPPDREALAEAALGPAIAVWRRGGALAADLRPDILRHMAAQATQDPRLRGTKPTSVDRAATFAMRASQ